jgi:hypothetical protein
VSETRSDPAADAAILIAGNHSESARQMLIGAIDEVALHHHTAGKGSREAWIAAIEQLGTVCLAIAKMQRTKYK